MTSRVTYNVDYDDADMGDIMTGNTEPGRGILLRFVRPDTTYFGHYMAWEGAAPGCKTFLIDDSVNYTVKVVYQASVNGNLLFVKTDTGDVMETTVETNMHPVNYQVHSTYFVGTNPRTHIMAAAGHAMYAHNLGVTGEEFDFLVEDCPDTDTSCDRWATNGYIYISDTSDHYLRKQIVVHEFGHAMADAANQAHATYGNDSASRDHCSPNYSSDDHKINSKEYQGLAAIEAIAHFYAAITFNSDNGFNSACEFEVHYRPDWNRDGDADVNDPMTFSCEVGVVILAIESPNDDDIDNRDYLGDWCTSVGYSNNRGTEYDWLRHFWDLYTDYGLSAGTILDIWDEANPHNWNNTGEGSGGAYPGNRMHNAAGTVGTAQSLPNLQNDYDACAALNGVSR